jgi:hypothetical protein
MAYFSVENLEELNISNVEAIASSDRIQKASKNLQQLHEKIYAQVTSHNMDLHILTSAKSAVVPTSASAVKNGGTLSVAYLRQKATALTVERLMGREEVASINTLESHRHPVIEIRLGSENLALELILSPDAWWDQQNLKGKLSVARHRHEMYELLFKLADNFCMGFWRGAHLSEMHLTANQFQHPRIMDEWMSTFEPGADWWRMGVWYDYNDEALSEEKIVETLVNNMRPLYAIYGWLAWTGDNNFREFYQR